MRRFLPDTLGSRNSGVSIRASAIFTTTTAGALTVNKTYNVSGVTRNGAGDYTVTFSKPMGSAYYHVDGLAQHATARNVHVVPHTWAQSFIRVQVIAANAGTALDPAGTVCVAVCDL